LYYEAEEWDELDWYIKKLYLDGLKQEGIIGTDEDPPQQPQPAKTGRQRTLQEIGVTVNTVEAKVPSGADWTSAGFVPPKVVAPK
jgi:hypothetical protein